MKAGDYLLATFDNMIFGDFTPGFMYRVGLIDDDGDPHIIDNDGDLDPFPMSVANRQFTFVRLTPEELIIAVLQGKVRPCAR